MNKFTKQHYKAIAEVLADWAKHDLHYCGSCRNNLEGRFSLLFTADNPS